MVISKSAKIVALVSWIAICLIYYNNNFNRLHSFASITDMQRTLSHAEIKYNNIFKGSEKYLINTPGCYIPNYSRTLSIIEGKFLGKTCGVRAIEVNKISNDKIQFTIDKTKMDTYSNGKTYLCCVRFASSHNISGKINITKLKYSNCTPFKNGSRIQLEEEIVTVSCASKLAIIYEDAYILLKKIATNKEKIKGESWNVLILGMDTMSRARLIESMPKTAQYLREHNWFDFRAYQKVGYNTFPNVMSLMTGKNVSSIYKACTKGLDKCKRFLIWNKFKKAGYITAYGEDFLRLPDTFTKFDGFLESPTDHYMRPFFLTGESRAGNFVCTKKRDSAKHILDYAYQFSKAYMNNKFYGLFWINSCSHNIDNRPNLYDEDFVAFFKKIHDNGVMNNTFIIFVSDHGLRYGSMRVPMESYFEERLPMCHIWVPNMFRKIFTKKYTNMQLNQEKLVTPYDLYLTMSDILRIAEGSDEDIASEACPLCNSLFTEISAQRTCADAGVHEKWCSCHNMTSVDKNSYDVIRSVQVAQEYLDNRTNSTKTIPCTKCDTFKLKTVLRSHLYDYPGENTTYYVVAIIVTPGDIGYEVVVQKYEDVFSIVDSMETITPYNPRGSCVKNPNDRGYCICKKQDNCK